MISPIMANGIVAQTQNVNLINNGEDQRPQVNYQQAQSSVETKRDIQHSTVISSQDSNKTSTDHDAREEGKNKYFDNRNASKKKKEEFGSVKKKQGGSGFDISI